MKLRLLFIITFCLIVIVPMTLFWSWPFSKALESELEGVNQKHLVIAKNLSATFERYYQDVTGIFAIIDPLSEEQLKPVAFRSLLENFKFIKIMVVDNNGHVKTCLFSTQGNCLKNINDDILNLANITASGQVVQLSTVTEDNAIKSGPIFLVVKKHNNDILLGYLSTEYIVKMGEKVAFGEKGHAAIVDQAGNVLAHPLEAWIKERKNISKISSVQKMLEGKTGVEKFYSPALKGDMIAGYTSVPKALWGVMVPQPIKELEDKAQNIDETAVFVMLLGLGLALLITIPISFVVITPLENLSNTIKLIERGDAKVDFQGNSSKIIPSEIRDLKQSFSNMMGRIEKNQNEITQLAYLDSNTGLPNRNYFYMLSKKVLKKMSNGNSKGALVFIDFDDFKLVNDTYGHRVGDELLFQFGKRISAFFLLGNEETKLDFFSDSLPEIIPARLGGDEFVILLSNVEDENEVKLRIEELFKVVFSEYILYDEITLMLTGSAGVALFPDYGKTSDELMKLADIAMYEAKKSGKNTIMFSK